MGHVRSHIPDMKPISPPLLPRLLLCAALALPVPAMAQDAPRPPAPEAESEDEPGLIGRGLMRLFEDVLRDMEPALDEMGRALQELEPIARDLAELLGDVRHYDPPERLPNGDIIIRRKPDAPPPPDIPSAPVDRTPPGPPQIDL